MHISGEDEDYDDDGADHGGPKAKNPDKKVPKRAPHKAKRGKICDLSPFDVAPCCFKIS